MKSPNILNYDLPDAARLSKDVPDAVKVAIANVVMAFSDMEMSAETVIWDLTGLSADDGKLLTQIGAREKLELLKKLSERYGIPVHAHRQTTRDIWSVVRQAVEARNKIAHSVWNMIDSKVPIAISYRIPTSLGRIMGEHFPIERLELVADNCTKIKKLFDVMAQRISSLPTKPTPVPTPRAATYPEYPLVILEGK